MNDGRTLCITLRVVWDRVGRGVFAYGILIRVGHDSGWKQG